MVIEQFIGCFHSTKWSLDNLLAVFTARNGHWTIYWLFSQHEMVIEQFMLE
jgi:hypothetical protein